MRYILIALLTFATLTTYAQTPTNTPEPDALLSGIFQFEDLSSPQIELTGNWYLSGDGLASDELGATMTFNVNADADYLIIYRQTTGTGGTWNICIDATPCRDVSDTGTGGTNPVAVELDRTYSEIVVTKTDSNESLFDFMQIAPGQDAIVMTAQAVTTPVVVFVPIVATANATSTPDFVQYAEATDEAGETYYTTRIENTVTTADQFNAHVFVMILVVLISLLVVTIWKT